MIHGGYIYDREIITDFSVNLNPLPMPQEIQKALLQSISRIHCYPDPLQQKARECLALLHNIRQDQVLGGNGASELIFGIVSMLQPKKALLLRPGFYGYEHALKAVNCQIRDFCLKEEEGFLPDEKILPYLTEDLDLLFLTNPNNPTGKLINDSLLRKILIRCRDKKISVLLDECFYEMSSSEEKIADRYRELLFHYPNLYVLKAFTKLFRIPGVRTGYVLSDAKNLLRLRNHLPEWNMSVIAQDATVACSTYLMETDYIKRTKALIDKERTFLENRLEAMGIKVFDSDCSFLLMRSEQNLYRQLLEHRILIRDCSNFKGLKEGYYRMAVKGREENQRVVAELSSIYF
ncbi:MAG: aminotransferase class I/II-fold pyridoxal phosphate-dependent enzyme [Lachnospiraceae bacterium]|nr:aminotransferase class I/II-fold pyridoxal phosphate-dependent enzyme [Lachnospiraceae bacterium]